MPVFTDAAPYYNGEALHYEQHPSFSRETVTVSSGSGVVKPNRVLGRVTATGEYSPWTPGAGDGSQNPVAVLKDGVDATAADVKATAWARGVVLNGAEVDFGAANAGQIAAAKVALTALGIVIR